MRCSRCGTAFSEARARLGYDCCLECGGDAAAAEIARRARMVAPIGHKSGYTYLGPDWATQRQRLLESSAKTPRLETGRQFHGRAPAPQRIPSRRYEFAGWEFKPDKRGIRLRRAILRELPASTPNNHHPQE
jgi:hypothetical protein